MQTTQLRFVDFVMSVFATLASFLCENKTWTVYDRSEQKTFNPDTISVFPSHHDFGVFADEVHKILQATPPKLRGKWGCTASWQTNNIEKRINSVRFAMPSHNRMQQHNTRQPVTLDSSGCSIGLNNTKNAFVPSPHRTTGITAMIGLPHA